MTHLTVPNPGPGLCMLDKHNEQLLLLKCWKERAEEAEAQLKEALHTNNQQHTDYIESSLNLHLKLEQMQAERDVLANQMADAFHLLRQRFGGAEDECYPDYYLRWAAQEVAKRKSWEASKSCLTS